MCLSVSQLLPNLLSPYSIEHLQLHPDQSQVVKLVIRGKKSFFAKQPRVVCQYDFRTRQMLCHNLNSQYLVEAEIIPYEDENFAKVMACLGLLCSKKICLHFPYCYAGWKKQLLCEKMTATLATLLDSIQTRGKMGYQIDPMFFASLLFQIDWALQVAHYVFGFRHGNLIPSNIGLLRIDVNGINKTSKTKGTSLVLFFQHGNTRWKVPSFGYLVKILPCRESSTLDDWHEFTPSSDLQQFSHLFLPWINKNRHLIKSNTAHDKQTLNQIAKILTKWQSSSTSQGALEDFSPLFAMKGEDMERNNFIFLFPENRQLAKQLVRECLF